MIGTLGPVVFEASSDLVRTFSDLSRSGQADWQEHKRIGRKGLLEFAGPGLEEISFSMRFDVFLGLNPRKEIDGLRELRDTGEVCTLILAGQPLGDFALTSLSESWGRVDHRGNLLMAEVQVSLKEYADAKT